MNEFVNIAAHLYAHLEPVDRATLRLVSNQLRDAIDLNIRGLNLKNCSNYRHIDNMHSLVARLPQLESIKMGHIYDTDDDVPSFYEDVFVAARRVRRLSTLVLENFDSKEAVCQVHSGEWPCLAELCLKSVRLRNRDDVFSVTALLHLSSLQDLSLDGYRLCPDAFGTLESGSGIWPQLQSLQLTIDIRENSSVIMRGLLHLSSLTYLTLGDPCPGSIPRCELSIEAVCQIQPDKWPILTQLCLEKGRVNGWMDDDGKSVKVIKTLLQLSSLQHVSLWGCDFANGVSQIGPGDWPHLTGFDLGCTHLDEDPVGAMQGLLHLSKLESLNLANSSLTGEAVSEIKSGDWPQLTWLDLHNNNLGDDPVGAMRGLLHLSKLEWLELSECEWSVEAVRQIKLGDWPHLTELRIGWFPDDDEAEMNLAAALPATSGLNCCQKLYVIICTRHATIIPPTLMTIDYSVCLLLSKGMLYIIVSTHL
jgi:hypothetical protein